MCVHVVSISTSVWFGLAKSGLSAQPINVTGEYKEPCNQCKIIQVPCHVDNRHDVAENSFYHKTRIYQIQWHCNLHAHLISKSEL